MSKKDITVFTVREDDEDTLNQIADITSVFAKESLIFKDMDFNRDKYLDFVSQFTQEGAILLAAKVGDEVVGYIPAHADLNYTDKVNLEVITLYVAPAYRNSGVGTALVDALCDTIDANDIGYTHVAICAFFEHDRELIQKATERLFKKKGFEQVGTILGRKGK